ncbi:MAG: SDR family NAD(P)-dependent oxidoreductase [Candidatus Heimdallarchaeota archaeon]|nr:SDR family NAD(P)-dependent oxidoreductase [Candidatus Heimdallarchaeota archaeon]
MNSQKNDSGNLVKNEFFTTKVPILIYNPPGIAQTELIIKAAEVGALGLVDLEFLAITEIKELMDKLAKKGLPFGIRVNPASETLTSFMTEELPEGLKVIVFTSKQTLPEDMRKEMYKFVHSVNLQVAQEVCTEQEAQESFSAGVDAVIPRGYEGGGRVSNQSTFVLFQQCIRHANGTAVIPKGGIGPRTAAALFAGGAAGVVLDTQVYTLPESPVNDEVKKLIRNMGENDTDVLCLTLERPYRCFAKIATKVVKDLKKQEAKLRKEGLSKKDQYITLRDEIKTKAAVGFKSTRPVNELLFIGQEGVFAPWFEKQGSLKNALKWFIENVQELLELGSKQAIFSEGAPLAQKHNTKYPFVQGPMANISDTPVFAKKIADGGALPMIALGNLPKEVTTELLEKTKKELGKAPFGCGIVGIEANAEARDIHLALLEKHTPPFALLAGGTPSMVQRLEKAGVATYYHTPSPQILMDGLERGLKRFIFEGMESGGHIGTLSSFVLWEQCLEILEERAKEGKLPENDLSILFAGGIHDDLSAAMVQTLCARIASLKVNCGLQMGTIYLFTEEIIKTESLKELYQQVAIDTSETRITGDTVNVRARSAPTPYVEWLIDREFARLEEGLSIKKRKLLFEKDTVGALRISARGVVFNKDYLEDPDQPVFLPVNEEKQLQKGNYLLGQVTALHNQDTKIKEIHEQIAKARQKVQKNREEMDSKLSDALMRLASSKPRIKPKTPTSIEISPDYFDDAVAIVGMGTVFPKGIGLDKYWESILKGKDACIEIPPEHWNWKFFYDPDPKTPDKSYTKIGAFVQDFEFDAFQFKIPPMTADHIDRFQQFGIIATQEALKEAGLLQEKIVNNPRMAVITANSSGGESRDRVVLRASFDEIVNHFKETPVWSKIPNNLQEKLIDETHENFTNDYRKITEDSMPGSLPNIASGRIANQFGAAGPNFISDAACGSTHAAIMNAIDCLNNKRADVVISGGLDSSMSAFTYILFCKVGALTPDGSRPFSKGANGFLMGEGGGIIVLKRLEDAVKENDKIYAVIRGIGASSDGKGKGITAPNPLGQALAIKRALKEAQVNPATISFIEAHGTSTIVGDIAEFQGLQEVFQGLPKESIGLTSVKSQIGHLKAAAGAAGIIKAALAIYHKTLPPQINFKEPNPHMDWDKSPFYVITEPKPWERITPDIPRRCGVSAFGFGGANFHIILEEFDEEIYQTYLTEKMKAKAMSPDSADSLQESIAKMLTTLADTGTTPSSSSSKKRVIDEKAITSYLEKKGHLESAVFCFSGNNPIEILNKAEKTAQEAKKIIAAGGRLRDAWTKPDFEGRYRLAIVAKDPDHFVEQIKTLKKVGMDPKALRMLANKGIFVGDKQEVDRGKTCFMFPGQGSQYLNMLGDLKEKYQIVKDIFIEADEIMEPLLDYQLSSVIFVDATRGTQEYQEAEEVLRQTHNNQPAMLTSDIAMYKMLEKLGVAPDLVIGHSLGEYAALIAAGILSFKDALYAVSSRGKEMQNLEIDDPGKMASISAGIDEVEAILAEIDGYVIPSNKNCYLQTVIGGESKAVEEAMARFRKEGIDAFPIPVSHAFHSAIVAPAIDMLKKTLRNLTINPPKIPILSNVTGDFYPMEGSKATIKKKIVDLLGQQIASSVEWIKEIQKAREFGCKVFVELGPKRALSAFTYNILNEEVTKGKVFTLLSNHPKKGGITTFNELLGSLWALGFDLQFPDLNDDTFYTEEFLGAYDDFVKETEQKEAPSEGIEKVVITPGKNADPEFAKMLEKLGPNLAKLIASITEESLRIESGEPKQPAETFGLENNLIEQKMRGKVTTTKEPESSISESLVEEETDHWKTAKKQVIDLVIKKTGYTEEMLELDYDLEGDLGIDTVKQVELFAVAREEFDLPRDEMVDLSSLSTLRDLVNYVATRTAPEGTDIISERKAETALTAGSPHWEETKKKVLQLFTEKTGYPEDMLELDLDLEADLGIDTVKQIELFALALDEFQLPRDDQINPSDFSTLADIVNYLARKTAPEYLQAEKEIPSVTPQQIEELKDQIHRWVLETELVEDLADHGKQPLKGKKALVIRAAENEKINEKALTTILGIEPIFATPEDLLSDKVDFSAVDGVINLYPLTIQNVPPTDKISTISKKAVTSLFVTCKALHEKLKEDGFFITVTGMGGQFGLDRNVNPAQGAVAGFVKTVAWEYPKADSFVLDSDTSLPASEIFTRISLELQQEKIPLEIGWDGNQRYKPALRIREPVQAKVLELTDGMKLLVSGGSRGITAEIIQELAKKAKLEFHIIGRSKEAPKELLQEIQATGSNVQYHSQDVTEIAGLKKLVKKIGPINGIIHGAGIDRSKLLMDKSLEEFELIFDVKVKGAEALLLATKDNTLDFFMTFSSVSGRFGNRGQVDYSAANDALNKFHGPIKAIHPNCVVKIVGWSAWEEIGMASKGSVKTLLKAGGITFIPVQEGVSLAVSELLHGKEKEVLYAGSLGILDKDGIMKWEEGVSAPTKDEMAFTKGIAPLVDEIVKQEEDHILVKRTLDGKREQFLPDHAIGGTMVLPGVMGQEMFAEVAELLDPEKTLVAFEDIRFEKAINIKEPVEVFIDGKVVQKNTKQTKISLKIYSKIFSEQANLELERVYFRGTVVLGTPAKKAKKQTSQIIPANKVRGKIKREEIYKHLFHDESFRVLQAVELLEEGGVGFYQPVTKDLFAPGMIESEEEIISSPLQGECVFQTAGIYVADQLQMMALPFRVEAIEIVDNFNITEKAIIIVHFKEKEEHTYRFDAEIFDATGKLKIKYRNFELKGYMGIGNQQFKKEYSIPFEELPTTKKSNLRVFRLAIDSLSKNHEDYQSLFSEEEWTNLFNKKMTVKRKREHLAGRLVAKCAIAWVESIEKATVCPLSEIVIQVNEEGKPFGIIGNERKELSISHSHDWAVASVSSEPHGIDLELSEKREPAFLKEAFTKTEEKELKKFAKTSDISEDMAITILFSAKEALLKRIGIGLKGGLKETTLKTITKLKEKDEPTKYQLQLNYQSKDYQVKAEILDNYVLTTTINEKS